MFFNFLDVLLGGIYFSLNRQQYVSEKPPLNVNKATEIVYVLQDIIF